MTNLFEVLVSCDTNNSLWTCCVWDPYTGTSLMTYKGGGIAEQNTLTFIGKDYLAAIEKTKPIMHVWPVNSSQTVQGMRFILPGKASALAISKDGSYCVAGIDEKLYLWQMASGSLLTIINRHYQKVVQVQFTPDGKYFVSAAEDGIIMVWSVSLIAVHPEVELVTQTSAGQHDPVFVFSDHTLPVTDLCVSKTGMHGRLYTVSSDRTCKIYDLASGEMLLNMVFDVSLSAVAVDGLELNVFLGTTTGKIYQFSLTNPPRSRDMLINSDDKLKVFCSHTKLVSCLSVSMDGETLMSGSHDEQIILWHIQSRQPVRVIRHKGIITNAFFTINLPATFKQEFSPTVVLHSLERTLEEDAYRVTEIDVLNNKNRKFWPETIEECIEEEKPTSIVNQNNENIKKSELEERLKNLQKINNNLYSIAVQKALTTVTSNSSIPSKRKRRNSKKNNSVI